ncbi:MAG: hypothetical protein Q4Q06_07530 [Bacteroidota bacterium]|nr:hypothetical protein [Bacteroidota bacterium]
MRIYTYILLVLLSLCLFSCDKKRQYTRQGNSSYNKQSYSEAEEQYSKALHEDSNFVVALHNLGNTYMLADSNYKASAKLYSQALSQPVGKTKKDTLAYANTLYNRGNAFFYLSQQHTQDSNSMEYLQQATKDYMQTLMLNPEDSNAKYNLALCLWLLKNDNQNNREQTEQQIQQVLKSINIKEKQALERAKLNRENTKSESDEKDW